MLPPETGNFHQDQLTSGNVTPKAESSMKYPVEALVGGRGQKVKRAT
jgi:hypothetical protein